MLKTEHNHQAKTLIEDYDFYKLALDNCPEDIFVVSKEGQVLYINQSACTRRATSQKRILKQKVWEWNHFVTESSWINRWSSLELSRNSSFQTEHIRPNGDRFPVRINVMMIMFGNQDAALCYVRDISAFKAIEKREKNYSNHLNLVFSGSGLCLCMWNPISNTVEFDNAWLSLFGSSSEKREMSFNDWQSMIDPKQVKEWNRRLTSHLLGQMPIVDMIFKMQRVDGKWIDIHARGQVNELDEMGSPSLVSILLEDISERLQMQSEISANLKALEHQAEALKLAKEQAEDNLIAMVDMERKRDLLYATVAHELRTPVASISMMASEDNVEEWSARQKDIQKLCRDLIHTLDDMRRLVNPNLGREVQLEPFQIPELMQAVATSVSAYTATTGVKFALKINLPEELKTITYQSDLYRLKIVLANLIKNACLHAEASNVLFSVQVNHSNEGEEFIWSVVDDGKGIPIEKIETLFQPLERGHTQAKGTGMGMYIAKTWIQEIGGELSFVPGSQGAQFNVHLAMQKVPELQENPRSQLGHLNEEAVDTRLLALRVLMVEDEPMLRMIGQKVLSKVFSKVDLASNGQEALDKISAQEYDLILTDYFMPEMNGLEMVKHLRENGCSSLIVGITAATLGTEKKDLQAAGADIVFSKPLNRQSLVAWLTDQNSKNQITHNIHRSESNVEVVMDNLTDIREGAKLIINLSNGYLIANSAWLKINEFDPRTEINSALLHSTIQPKDLERFKSYAVSMIKDPQFGKVVVIELDLISQKGRQFKGRISSKKFENDKGVFIESTLVERVTH